MERQASDETQNVVITTPERHSITSDPHEMELSWFDRLRVTLATPETDSTNAPSSKRSMLTESLIPLLPAHLIRFYLLYMSASSTRSRAFGQIHFLEARLTVRKVVRGKLWESTRRDRDQGIWDTPIDALPIFTHRQHRHFLQLRQDLAQNWVRLMERGRFVERRLFAKHDGAWLASGDSAFGLDHERDGLLGVLLIDTLTDSFHL
ncbi:hypothetical protein RRF57_011376 [Xylaria bambusicola]|uniref:Uncharacterized protein n=1 Tax=Xylaria bambusicola TaxID=326684 RepID=A0AAN7UWM7_9PEZI